MMMMMGSNVFVFTVFVVFCFPGNSVSLSVENCHPDAMAMCTDPLKVVTNNKDLGFATSLDELQQMCPKLMDGLRCINDFTYRCLDSEHRNYFNTLYQGTTQVIVDLCKEGPYQSDYLRHAPCMRKVQSGYEKCADEYQVRIKSLNEAKAEEEAEGDDDVRMLCCSFQQYLHCSEGVVNSTCGPETARFTKGFLDRMSGPLIQGHCQAYERQGLGCEDKTHLKPAFPDETELPSQAEDNLVWDYPYNDRSSSNIEYDIVKGNSSVRSVSSSASTILVAFVIAAWSWRFRNSTHVRI